MNDREMLEEWTAWQQVVLHWPGDINKEHSKLCYAVKLWGERLVALRTKQGQGSIDKGLRDAERDYAKHVGPYYDSTHYSTYSLVRGVRPGGPIGDGGLEELQMNKCEICGKPQSPYPNWIVSKGRQMHIGCMADALEQAERNRAFLLDKCIASGAFGPFSDEWTEGWNAILLSKEVST